MISRLGRVLRWWADLMDPDAKPHLLPAHTVTLESDGVRFRTDGRGARVCYIGEGLFR